MCLCIKTRGQQWTSLNMHCYTLGSSVSRTDPQMWGCWIKGISSFPHNLHITRLCSKSSAWIHTQQHSVKFPLLSSMCLDLSDFCQAKSNKSIIILTAFIFYYTSFSFMLEFCMNYQTVFSVWFSTILLILTVYKSSLHTDILPFI